MTETALDRLSPARRPLARLGRLGTHLFTAWGLIAAILLVLFVLDRAQAVVSLRDTAASLAGTMPYIVFAVVLIAWMRASGAEATIARAFEGREMRMIVLASLLGALAPLCSCEVVPLVAGLLAAGAPLSAIMAFWLSSPLNDPASLIITAGAVGWDFAIGRAVAAISIGLAAGLGVMALCRAGLLANPLRPDAPGAGCCAARKSTSKPVWRFWREAGRRGTFASEASKSALFLIKWLTLAYLLETLLRAYVPAEAIASVVGGSGIGPIVLGAAVGVPAYLNGYAAPPLIAGLMEQGMSAGAAMAFMTAGAATCIPAMAAVFSLVRRPVFAAYLAFGFGGAILAGLAFAGIARWL